MDRFPLCSHVPIAIAVCLLLAAIPSNSLGNCDDGGPGQSTWTVTDPDAGDSYDVDVDITAMGRGICDKTAVVKLEKFDSDTGNYTAIESESNITVNNEEDWTHTFEPPAEGWDPGTYRVSIEGTSSSDESGDFTITDA